MAVAGNASRAVGPDPTKRDEKLSDLRRARQEALDALLRMRLEGKSGRALAKATRRAQRAVDALLAARLTARQ